MRELSAISKGTVISHHKHYTTSKPLSAYAVKKQGAYVLHCVNNQRVGVMFPL